MAATPIPVPIRAQIAELVHRDGEPLIVRRLGISRPTLYRLLAGLPITAGSAALVRARLDALAAEERRRAEERQP